MHVGARRRGLLHVRAPLRAQQNSLLVKLNAAQESLAVQDYADAINQLGAFINQVEALNRSRRLDAITTDSLIAIAREIIATIP